MKRFFALSLFLGLTVPLAAEGPTPTPASVPAATPQNDAPVAKVGSTVLTEKQMRDELGSALLDAERQLYRVKRSWIFQKAKNLAFDQAASKAGLTRQAWDLKEIEGRLPKIDEAEVTKVLDMYAQGRTEEQKAQIRNQIKAQMMSDKRQQRETELYSKLAKAAPVELLIPKPMTVRLDVKYRADDPVTGPQTAPVTILEFTDFQCPFCKKSQPTLHQIEKAYPKEVKLVARQYPLPMHSRAKPAAEAALCAQEQGKFWPYREKLFASASLEDADFTRVAKEARLDTKKFDECYASHRNSTRVDEDIAAGMGFGVRGTPHFFINGQPLSGALPFDEFDEAIQDALQEVKKAKS